MSCCKNNVKEEINKTEDNKSLFKKIYQFLGRLLTFIFMSLIVVPIVIPISIYSIYKICFSKEKNFNINKLSLYLIEKLKPKDNVYQNDNDDEDDWVYELENENDIMVIKEEENV
jgi:archaellum biogenesis protein FlaJ (TadC family)